MNTEAENAYYELMGSSRINFKTIETKEVEYDFKITPEIMDEFNKWKLETTQLTDEEPTELEMLEYFKKVNTISCGGNLLSPDVKVISIEIIDADDL
jgi:hypothetical protein